MDPHLFRLASFLSRPPGFYLLIAAMGFCTALIPFGLTDIVTYALSVAAILITGVVLIQGNRDTAAIHAKLDEIVLSLNEARNHVVGLEHSDAKDIKRTLKQIEHEAATNGQPSVPAASRPCLPPAGAAGRNPDRGRLAANARRGTCRGA